MHQTIEGRSIDPQYDPDLGGNFIFGWPGGGKSRLIQSNPRAIIIGLDPTYKRTWNPEDLGLPPSHRAFIYPDDLPGNENKSVRDLAQQRKWASVEKFLERLKTNPMEGYTQLYFDSYTSMKAVLQTHISKTANPPEKRQALFGGFGDVASQYTWTVLNEQLSRWAFDLMPSGLAVGYTFHLQHPTVKNADGSSTEDTSRWVPSNITSNLWGQMSPLPSNIVVVEKKTQRGRSRADEPTYTTRLHVDPSKMQGVCKVRSRSFIPPETDLDPVLPPWEAYRRLFTNLPPENTTEN